ncbi:MAG: DsbE family thiol:disulfide interchange protein [Gammaproteobacteria bacterium]|nr:DsbE family thiol:disulfide interchange protein [Gammaproteobacteria bacterium]
MWRYAMPIVLFAVLGVFLYRGLYLNPGSLESPLVGRPAPEFSLPSLEDPLREVGSDDFAGQVALLNVWATWCVGCRQEHPYLLELARTSGIPIYGLNWKDDRAAALEWLARLGDPYVASAFDSEGDVAIDWGVYGAPETFLIGRDGTVLHKHIGPLMPEIWRRDFLPKIAKECGSLPCPLVDGEE